MTIVEMSVGGAVLIAVILLLRRCLLYRLPKWTFLFLWAVALCRLLVPFTLPSQFSVYTGAARVVQVFQKEEEPSTDVQIPVLMPPVTVPGTFREGGPVFPAVSVAPEPEQKPISPLTAVWLTGTALCGLFFAAAYLWTLCRFWGALPAESDFLRRWWEERPTLRTVQVKTCGAVNAPVAYGLIHPIILLPENTDWADEGQLTYIMTHEYVHIHRGDLLWKLLLMAALCVHWFNPLVWAMYFCANRDLELACDEAVVRILGMEHRKDYAYALLSAAESGFSPLCLTYTTKNHMEERIRAIMKLEKRSVAAIFTAVLLVAGVTVVFATSKAPDSPLQAAPAGLEDPAVSPTQGDTSALENVPAEAAFTWPLPQEYQEITYPFTKQGTDPLTGQAQEHLAIDVAAPKGTAVYAAKSGVVTRSDLDKTYGSLVEITHNDGTATLYAHLSERDAEIGQRVKQGEAIGTVGATGNATGTVLHFGILVDGSPTDPAGYFEFLSPSISSADITGDATVREPQEFVPQEPALQKPAQPESENRWGVPANPIPSETSIPVADEQDMRDLILYLRLERGYTGSFGYEINNATGKQALIIPSDNESMYAATEDIKIPDGLLPDGSYPRNSRGETYGTSIHERFLGYRADLIAVIATNGESGYVFKSDFDYFDVNEWARRNHKTSSNYDEWLKLHEEYSSKLLLDKRLVGLH